MIQSIDMSSPEFKAELEKTWKFVKKVNKQFGFVQHPQEDVNEGVALGLARNKLLYGKRYCPCFMVIGDTPEERKKADNRICPCKPALEKEIPEEGKCHCGIFCSPEFVEEYKKNNS
jgi:ferredoxin-thioredoxin reductase catalytic subunit